MSLLSPPPEPSNKSKVWTFTIAALTVALAIVLYFSFRYYPEKKASEHFLDALVAGNTNQAYQLWKPSASYKLGDFLADLGPEGNYGPWKSYSFVKAASRKGANGLTPLLRSNSFSPGRNSPRVPNPPENRPAC